MIMNRLFWESERFIESPNIIEDFFSSFNFDEKEFTIVFKVKWRKMNSFIAQVEGWEFSERLADDIIRKIDRKFGTARKDEKYREVQDAVSKVHSVAWYISMITDDYISLDEKLKEIAPLLILAL